MMLHRVKKYAAISGIVVVLFVAIGVLAWSSQFGQTASSVPCINESMPLLQHIHPRLTIIVDNTDETIPANIGITPSCTHAIHTHDETGVIHVEAQDWRVYTLGDFFAVWGQPIQRLGYGLEMTVNGEQSTAFDGLVLEDNQNIVMTYSRLTSAPQFGQ